MPKHGTALTPGQRVEFLKTGIGALILLSHDPNFDPTTADGWAKNGGVMLREFGRLLIPAQPDPAKGIVKTMVTVIGGGRTTDQIIKAAKKLEGRNKPSFIYPDIKQANVPSGHGGRRLVVLEFFEFDHDPITKEIQVRCEEPGYGYPTYEDGLRFQEDRPDDQRERPHIFIPESPWCDTHGNPQALNLRGDADDRELDLVGCNLGDRRDDAEWSRDCLFARRKYC